MWEARPVYIDNTNKNEKGDREIVDCCYKILLQSQSVAS